ncbi:hypothetical protein DFH06DRAFT_1318515 [Mycena polygramma]|nr:hypothetical protein DFH06DRAFT_1318515 [Mycena polygramma]
MRSLELFPHEVEGWNEADAAESVFRLIPSLTHLQLTFTNVGEAYDLSRPLVLRPLADPTILPNLSNLTMRGYIPDSPGYEALVNILSARRAHAHRRCTRVGSFGIQRLPKHKPMEGD